MAKTPMDLLKDARMLHNHGAFGPLQQAQFFKDMDVALAGVTAEVEQHQKEEVGAKPEPKPVVTKTAAKK